jgi:1-acyl-sn-glycerol-3-phosphate acyltransferase
VQTLALTYTKIYGLPLGRRGRHVVAWYGDMDLASHAWRLLGLGPLDAHIRIGAPVPLDQFQDRKALARYAEERVRNDVVAMLRD